MYEDAIVCWKGESMKKWKERLIANAELFDFPIHKPVYQLTDEQKELLWKGNKYFYGLDRFFRTSRREKIQNPVQGFVKPLPGKNGMS